MHADHSVSLFQLIHSFTKQNSKRIVRTSLSETQYLGKKESYEDRARAESGGQDVDQSRLLAKTCLTNAIRLFVYAPEAGGRSTPISELKLACLDVFDRFSRVGCPLYQDSN